MSFFILNLEYEKQTEPIKPQCGIFHISMSLKCRKTQNINKHTRNTKCAANHRNMDYSCNNKAFGGSIVFKR